MADNENIVAENILKRAELARLTRQLKSRLSQTKLRARLQEKQPKRPLEAADDGSHADDDESPVKRPAYPPSSPVYEFAAPSTPPAQKITIEPSSVSTDKTQIHVSSPAHRTLFATPKRKGDEGADLLLFLATSPSPVQYKHIPSTPSRKNLASAGTPKNRLRTPGFNLNDYLVFTPSPAIARAPGGELGKDVNGKLIEF